MNVVTASSLAHLIHPLTFTTGVACEEHASTEQVPYRSMLAQQRTSIRERRPLRLDDGSQLALNADTALDIRFDSKQRLIQLYRGEMLVKTAQDPTQRPFIVQTGEGRARALDTRFSVRQLAEQRVLEYCKPLLK